MQPCLQGPDKSKPDCSTEMRFIMQKKYRYCAVAWGFAWIPASFEVLPAESRSAVRRRYGAVG
jgi:hypothetical protein